MRRSPGAEEHLLKLEEATFRRSDQVAEGCEATC